MTSFYQSANKYYNDQQLLMGKYINLNKNYKFEFNTDPVGNSILEMYDDDNKIVLKAEYCFIGIYNLINSVWYWAWNVEFLDKKLAEKSKVVKQLKKDLVNDYEKYLLGEIDELYFYSSNGNFFVSHDNVVKLAKLMLYLAKGLWFLTVCPGKNNSKSCMYEKGSDESESVRRLEYVMITKIVQSNI